MYYQKEDNLEVWCELGMYTTQFKNPEIKILNESNKFLEGDPDVDIMLEAGREKLSAGIEEIPDTQLEQEQVEEADHWYI